MSKIKVSEIFYSLQGEGRFMGTPSVFLRTFGCNFTCSGFGMPRGEKSTERDEIAETHKTNPWNNYKHLPLVHTGCDSYASWDPRFKDLSPMLTIEAIVDEIQRLLPGGKFGMNKHLVITGGEPLLGWQRSFPALLDEIEKRGMTLTHLTFETNGTQMLDPTLAHKLQEIYDVTFSVSAKLPISGETWEDAIRPECLYSYRAAIGHDENHFENMYLKFVIGNQQDFEDAQRAHLHYNQAGVTMMPVYLMPVGGTPETYKWTELDVANIARDNGYRFSPRLQIPLYKNAWGT